MEPYLGQLAGLMTSVFWALTSIFFTMAGQRVGSRIVNRTRLVAASGMLAIAHSFAQGAPFPFDAEAARWGWLFLSAVAGLVIGDGLLFYAFTQIGARLSMLLMALTPVIGTLLAWAFLGEILRAVELVAITVTIGGVAWVVLERNAPAQKHHTPRDYLIGVLCGLGGAAGQAVGLVLSKQGMVGEFPTLSASLMRVVIAAVILWLIAGVQGKVRESIAALEDRQGLKLIIIGAFVGPVMGMSLSLVAVRLSNVGLASTLMALSPVILLPLGYWIFDEKITFRAVMGTVVALAGVAMIFLL